jgi:hypothetical protein
MGIAEKAKMKLPEHCKAMAEKIIFLHFNKN